LTSIKKPVQFKEIKQILEIRIDEKLKVRKKQKLGIEVGDFINFDPRTEVTKSGSIKSPPS